jgi:hypothetical protein
MSTCAHPLERRVDLTERGLGHRDIAASLGKDHQGDTLIAVTPGPAEGHSISGPFLQRLTIGGDGLFQPCRPALALSKAPKHNTQIVLGADPVERHSLWGQFLQRLAVGRYASSRFAVPSPWKASCRRPYRAVYKTPPSKKNRRNSPKECAIFVKN